MNAVKINLYEIAFLDILECLVDRLYSQTFACVIARAVWHKCDWNSLFVASKHHSVHNFVQCSIPAYSNQSARIVCGYRLSYLPPIHVAFSFIYLIRNLFLTQSTDYVVTHVSLFP